MTVSDPRLQMHLFFTACPEFVFFPHQTQWFLLECIISTYFYLDIHVALPERPDPGNTSTNPLPIWRWCLCSLSMTTSPSKPAGNKFLCISHLCISHLCYIGPLILHLFADKSRATLRIHWLPYWLGSLTSALKSWRLCCTSCQYWMLLIKLQAWQWQRPWRWAT